MIKGDGRIYYLEQRVADLPQEDDWLSSAEQLILGSLCIPKRRTDWRLGRWTAKRTVSACLGWSGERLREIEVRSSPSGAPEITVPGRARVPEISISHSCGMCMCAVGTPGMPVGCDIEKVEVRSLAFMQTFFSQGELAALATLSTDEKRIVANVIWSAKESYLKSTREGLTRDTKEVDTIFPATFDGNAGGAKHRSWFPIWVTDGPRLSVAYWRLWAGFIETVCRQGAPIPAVLNISHPDCDLQSNHRSTMLELVSSS